MKRLIVGIFGDIFINDILLFAYKNIVFKDVDGTSSGTGKLEISESRLISPKPGPSPPLRRRPLPCRHDAFPVIGHSIGMSDQHFLRGFAGFQQLGQ